MNDLWWVLAAIAAALGFLVALESLYAWAKRWRNR